MDKQYARKIITETFENPFDKGRFTGFIRNLLNHIEDSSFTYQGNYIPEKFRQYIKSLERIGKFSDGENSLDILVITLHKETSLERARTMQRNFIAWYLNGSRGGEMKDAALVAYVSPDKTDWRFSLVKMDYKFEKTQTGKMKVKEEFTPARRWSFLVGANEKSHTAQSRLVSILANDEQAPTLSELENAFDIETVTKEFFLKYRELFLRTKEALEKVVRNDPKIKADFEAKGVDTVNFAKKLLGQIVFLYFLQKKGWFGVGRDDDWGTGSKHFLRQLFAGSHGSYKNFFNDILEPLFYEALRIDRGHDDDYYSRFNCKIPFLNGGLFDPIGNYDWVHTDINLPNELFSNSRKTKEGDEGDGILDVFDRYNFTVREDEPLEKEVAIDPELLGKAYEKFNAIRPDNFDEFTKALKSGKKGEENKFNKKFGVYYTPREIVHYMCKQSLINYLYTQAEEAGFSSAIKKQDIEDLIEVGEMITEHEATALIKQENIKNGNQKSTEYTALLSDSIQENAATIDQWLEDITVCDPAVGSGAFPVGMMNEIVRARNVLSVFLNDRRRNDYEFKRRCIEHSLYGVDIDSGAVEIAKLRLWLSLVVDEEDIKNIKPLPNLDYKIVCGDSLLGVEKDLFNHQLFNDLEKLKPLFFAEANPTKKQEYKKQIDDLISQITKGHTEFDFEVYFSEVFHRKGGFDVVIANPPYVSVEKFARTAQQDKWKRKFKTYASRGDIYCFFYERAFGLLRENGILTFISSNKFQRAGYGKGLRQLLLSNRIEALLDFCELPVFAAATDPMIVLVSKGAPTVNHKFPVVVIKNEAELKTLAQSLAIQGTHFKPEQLREDGWSLEGRDGFALLNKIRTSGIPLEKYVNGRFYYGIKTGLNEAFVIDRVTRERLIREDIKSAELIKPWIRGKDIKRWTHEYYDLYVIIVRHGFHTELKKYPAILHHLAQFEKKLKARGQCRMSRADSSKGQHHWLELDNNPSKSYIDAFDEPKIVYNETSKRLHAYLDTEKNAINKTGFIILTPDAGYVLAILNSTLMDWFYRSTFPSWGDPWSTGRLQFRGNLMGKVPIAAACTSDKSRLTKLSERAAKQAQAKNSSGLQETEKEIDQLVYKLYGLTEEEIRIVEGKTK
ncbi:MAG: TaqI-like C-terminal specificity domain-containing protein [Petrimonas mucosa]